MTQQTTRTANTAPRDPGLTRALLGCGVAAGPVYVAVSLAQALTREGFDLTRHAWSMLANGGPGWTQIANLVLAGPASVACAAGLRRALSPGRGATWAPRLVGAYGLSLVGAGIFRADPGMGFPAGAPEGPGPVSWHGMLHFRVREGGRGARPDGAQRRAGRGAGAGRPRHRPRDRHERLTGPARFHSRRTHR